MTSTATTSEERTRQGLGPAFSAARARLALIALLFALAGVAWWSTVERMQGMDAGPGTGLGTLGWFLGVWVVMMAAMMFPSVSPTVALYSRMAGTRSPVAPLVFAGGYLLAWAVPGLLAYGIYDVAHSLFGDSAVVESHGPLGRRAEHSSSPRRTADADQGRLPRQVPQPARLSPRLVARRPVGRAEDGNASRRVVHRLLLGVDGVPVRTRRDEHRVDGIRRRADRRREDLPGGRAVTYGTAAILLVLGVLLLADPSAIPGLTIPGSGNAPSMQMP